MKKQKYFRLSAFLSVAIFALGFLYYLGLRQLHKTTQLSLRQSQLPPALGKVKSDRGPASQQDPYANSQNCTETSSNSCFNVIRCEVDGGWLTSYIDPSTQTTFAFVSSTLNFRSPGKLLGDFEPEFHQARNQHNRYQQARRTQNRQQKQNQAENKLGGERHRQAFSTEHFSAHIARRGRFVKAKYVMNQNLPTCLKPGDIQ